MRMRSTDFEGMSTRLGSNNERSSISVIMKEVVERVMEVTVERDDLLLRLNQYKESKDYLERILSEQSIILKAVQA